MKKLKNILAVAAAASILALSSCSNGSTDSAALSSSTGNGQGGSFSSDQITDKNAQWKAGDFMNGVDVSNLTDIENNGAKFLDTDGTEKNMLQILANHGVNWIRLRVWNDPTRSDFTTYASSGTYFDFYNYGFCTSAKAAAMAKRAKDLGMHVLLDLHFSDTWTDPGKQRKPKAWDDLTEDQLVQAVSDFTKAVITEMKDAGGCPDMVQIGNEIDTGLLLTKSDKSSTSVKGTLGTGTCTKILSAGTAAVKSIDTNIITMIHFARGGSTTKVKGMLENISGVTDVDAIGLSYYPFYTSHGTLEGLGETVKYITGTLNKKCMVAETGFPWTCGWDNAKHDNINNDVWYTSDSGDGSMQQAYNNLNSSASKYGIEMTTFDGTNMGSGTTNIAKPSPENQKAFLRAVRSVVKTNGGEGMFYWGGEWVFTGDDDKGSTRDNQTLFDLDHKATEGINGFNDDNAPEPPETPAVTWPITKNCTWTDDAVEVATKDQLADVTTTLTITTTNIGGSTSDSWWFWANTDGDAGDSVAWSSGTGSSCIYTVTITDSTKISYLKTNGLWMKGASGLTSSVTLSK